MSNVCHTKVETVMNNFVIPQQNEVYISKTFSNDFYLSLKANLEVFKSPKLV